MDGMMSIKQFADQIAMIIRGDIFYGADGRIGITLTEEDSNVRPVLWLNNAYQDYISGNISISEIACIASRTLDANRHQSIDFSKDSIIPKIQLRLYNKMWKTNDVYMSANEFGFPDLILIPYINNIIENGSVMIDNHLLNKLNISEESVFSIGFDNLKYEVYKMTDILSKYIDGIDYDFPMYIITNKAFCFGAASIIPAKAELSSMFKNGYVVLPSSVHECIVIPYNDDMKDELVRSIIRGANYNSVDINDRLSYEYYIFK